MIYFLILAQYLAYIVNYSKTSVQAIIDMFITMISHELQSAPTKQKLGCLFKSVFRLTGNGTQNVHFWSFMEMILRWFPSRGTSNTEKFPHHNVTTIDHDDVIKWKHFPRYWLFVRGIHRSTGSSPHKDQWSFDVFFDLRLYKRLSKQSWGWWFETLLRPLWRHRNVGCVFWQQVPTFTESCALLRQWPFFAIRQNTEIILIIKFTAHSSS